MIWGVIHSFHVRQATKAQDLRVRMPLGPSMDSEGKCGYNWGDWRFSKYEHYIDKVGSRP